MSKWKYRELVRRDCMYIVFHMHQLSWWRVVIHKIKMMRYKFARRSGVYTERLSCTKRVRLCGGNTGRVGVCFEKVLAGWERGQIPQRIRGQSQCNRWRTMLIFPTGFFFLPSRGHLETAACWVVVSWKCKIKYERLGVIPAFCLYESRLSPPQKLRRSK